MEEEKKEGEMAPEMDDTTPVDGSEASEETDGVVLPVVEEDEEEKEGDAAETAE